MTPTVLLGSSDMVVQKETQSLEIQAVSISTGAEIVRLFLWSNGCDTLELDNHLALGPKSVPRVGPLVSSDAKEVGMQGNNQRKILSRGGSDSRTGMDANQQDRIILWLLRNLQESSEEKIRHRSFLADAENLDEEKWARLVLKYRRLDDAAAVPRK